MLEQLIHDEIGRISIGHSLEETTERITRRIKDCIQSADVSEKALRYHVPLFVQHLLKDPNAPIRINHQYSDAEDHDVFHGVNTKTPLPLSDIDSINRILGRIPDVYMWRYFVENFNEIRSYFYMNKDWILNQAKGKTLLVVSNHATWANLPFLAFCLNEFLGIPRDQIHTIVGPAILTNQFTYDVGRRFSNFIETWPDTFRAQTGYPGIHKVRTGAFRKITTLLKDPPQTHQIRCILLAPSGTSDVDIDEGKFLLMYKPTLATSRLMERVGGENILPIGINDRAILGSHGKPKRGSVILRIGGMGDTKNALEVLPKLVQNEKGKDIGFWGVDTRV